MHTFLFSEATWIADGRFVLENGIEAAAHGRTVVRHGPGEWVNEGRVVLDLPEGELAIENVYRIEPFEPEDGLTSWSADNPALGRLRGTFAVVDDTILSSYESEDGSARGIESLRRVDAETYRARGCMILDGELASSWSVRLRREATGRSHPSGGG